LAILLPGGCSDVQPTVVERVPIEVVDLIVCVEQETMETDNAPSCPSDGIPSTF